MTKDRKRLQAQLKRGNRLHGAVSTSSLPSGTSRPVSAQQFHKEQNELHAKLTHLEESNSALQHISEASVQVIKASNDRIEELSKMVAELQEQLQAANEQIEIQAREIEGHWTASIEYVQTIEQRCEEAINDRAALKQRLKHAEHEVRQLSDALQDRDGRIDRMSTELELVKQENEIKTQRVQYLQQHGTGARKCKTFYAEGSGSGSTATH